MRAEELWHELLELDQGWEVTSVCISQPDTRIVIAVRETAQLWSMEICPKCEAGPVAGCDHEPARQWRHLDILGRPTFVECALPHGQCRTCGYQYVVKAPWQGRSKDFTWQFAAHLLTSVRTMGIDKARQFLGETETRLWSTIFAHVDQPSRPPLLTSRPDFELRDRCISPTRDISQVACSLKPEFQTAGGCTTREPCAAWEGDKESWEDFDPRRVGF